MTVLTVVILLKDIPELIVDTLYLKTTVPQYFEHLRKAPLYS